MNLKKVFDSMEPICDMATIRTDRENNCRLTVNPDLNRKGDEYFKFYNSSKKISGEKVARILFRKCGYVFHNNGNDAWMLNSSEKKLLMKILNSNVKTMNGRDVTIFQYAIIQYNREKFGMEEDDTLSNDFSEFKDALPIDLPMPNYLELK